MADILIEEIAKIQEIYKYSNRLHYLLKEKYKLSPEKIKSIRLDSDNLKIDINLEDTYLRFKFKSTEEALMKNPENGILELVFDPALAQGIINILDEFKL